MCNIESSVAVTENFVRAETIQRTLDAVERPHSVARITAAITSWLYALTRPITPHAQAHAALCSVTIVSARSLLIGKPGFDVVLCCLALRSVGCLLMSTATSLTRMRRQMHEAWAHGCADCTAME